MFGTTLEANLEFRKTMEYKILTGNFKIPVIGLGTFKIGGSSTEPDFSEDKESIQAIKDAIALWYSHIDTAELYGATHTEELIGEAIKDFERSKLIITSKVYKTHLHYDDIITSCKKSLERLQTAYIDIYLIHAPNPEIPLQETMEALDFLLEQGFIKHIGVSNFSVEQMKEAQKYSKYKIAVNQIPYNLSARNEDYKGGGCSNMEIEIIPYCQENDILVMAYRPIERGFLLQSHPLLDTLSVKYGKTKAQIAIQRLISKKNIVTICKATQTAHIKENLGAMWWTLNNEDIEALDATQFGTPNT